MSPENAHRGGARGLAETSPRSPRGKWIGLGLVGLLFAVWAGVFIYRTSFVAIDGERTFCLFDDSMISMRYAWNLAHGNGLVWNPGQRVEGITNLLMTLLMAVPTGLLDKSGAVLAVQIAGVGFLLAIALVTLRIGEALVEGTELEGSATLPVLFAAAALAYYPLNYWTLMGMETGLLTLLLSAAVWTAFRVDGDPAPSAALAVLLGLAFVTRPDAAIPVALIMLHRLYGLRRRRGWLRAILSESATIAGFVAAVSAFRWGYYGSITPNTYTLKVEGFELADRLANGVAFNQRFLDSMLVPLAVAVGAVALRRHRHGVLVLALMLSSMAYEVWVGGDSWPYWRINAPFAPALFALGIGGVALALRRLAGRVARRRGAWARAMEGAAVVAATLALLHLANADFLEESRFQKPAYWVGANWENVDTALALTEVLRPGATVGVVWGGTIPYYSGFEAVDFLGKSDPTIAALPPDLSPPPSRRARRRQWRLYNPGHNKHDLDYSIVELQPTYVQKPYRRLMIGERQAAAFLRQQYAEVRYRGVPLLLRRGSPEVDWAKLEAGAGAGPGL